MVRHKTIWLGAVTLLLILAVPCPSPAASSNGRQKVGNLVIYLGVIPAQIVLGHPVTHPEASMHGGPPAGAREYHVLVVLFDARTGERISHAAVSARVSEIGLVGEEKKLEPMNVAGMLTYGNYFKMSGDGAYRIRLNIQNPREAGEVVATFKRQHR